MLPLERILKSSIIIRLFAPILILSSSAAMCSETDHSMIMESYRERAESAPPGREKDEKLGTYYLTLAGEQINQRKYSDALEALDSAEKHGADRKVISYYRGASYFYLSRTYEAERELESIAYEGTVNAAALSILGKIYYDRGDLWLAIERWEKAVVLKPGDHELAELLSKVKKESKAEEKMGSAYSGKFLVKYDGEKSETAGSIVISILEDAYYYAGTDLDFYPDSDIHVIIYAKKDFKEVTALPDWAGGVYDGKIRVPSGGLKEATEELKGLLYHEYTHALVNLIAGGRAPLWLNEGLAVYEERKAGFNTLGSRRGIRPEGKIDWRTIDMDFSSQNAEKAGMAYETSFSFINHIAEDYGIFKLAELLRAIKKGHSVEESFKKVFSEFDMDLASLEKEWAESFQ